MLISHLCDYVDVHIVDKWELNLETDMNDNMPRKDVALKNNAPFMSWITKFK